MASVQYQLFCKCVNPITNKAITNRDTRTWVSAFDTETKISDENLFIKEVIDFKENADDAEKEIELQNKLIYGVNMINPKYDLLFVHSGCDIKYGESTGYPNLLTDTYSRIFMSPWFIHSTHSSLNSVMTKAQQLVDKIGHSNIKIGKVVPLDQYIEII